MPMVVSLSEDIFVPEAEIVLTFDSIPPCNSGADGSATVNPIRCSTLY